MGDQIRLHTAATLEAGASVPLRPDQAHYLGSVMRRASGDEVRVFNTMHGEWRARIAALRKGTGALVVLDQLRLPMPESGPILAFAPLKRDATDLVVQKATELGAAELIPVLTERTVATRVNLDRLAAIAAEAAEQSERLSVPSLRAPVRLSALLGAWPPGVILAAALERQDAPMLGPGPGALLVGPEGGFTGLELDLLRSRAFVVPVSLGPRVLRAETAVIAGLARMLSP